MFVLFLLATSCGLDLTYLKPKQMQILVDLVNDDKKSGGVNSLVRNAGAATQGPLFQIVQIILLLK